MEKSSPKIRVSGATQDLAAIALSTLCAVHCVLTPVVLALLPAGLLWLGDEWMHRVFVLVAVPLSGYAIVTSLLKGRSTVFAVSASIGLVLLALPAVFESLHSYEAALTLTGASILAGAHISRWAVRQDLLHSQQQGA